MTPVNDELIELRGLRFHYRDWRSSKPDAPTLVLLHGYTGHSRYWDVFAQAMTDRHRVLVLDQRGHGESGWSPSAAYGTDEMMLDLRAFVSGLSLARFTLVGLSMGGLVSIRYAGEQPAELERLVIVDIGPEIESSGLARIQTGAQGNDRFASREAAYQAARAANPRPPESNLRHRTDHALMLTERGDWTWRYDRALRDASLPRGRMSAEQGWAMLARITVPTLLIRGDDSDILSLALAQKMIATLRNGQYLEVPNAGHSVPPENPDGFLKAARQFLI